MILGCLTTQTTPQYAQLWYESSRKLSSLRRSSHQFPIRRSCLRFLRTQAYINSVFALLLYVLVFILLLGMQNVYHFALCVLRNLCVMVKKSEATRDGELSEQLYACVSHDLGPSLPN